MDERPRAEPTGEERGCPNCDATSPAEATACTTCGWPFAERRPHPPPRDTNVKPAREPKPAPGLYMGRDAALHDAAAREEPGGWAWALWIAVQIVCALLFVGLVLAVALLRARPAGLGLLLMLVVALVGARALWRFAAWLTAPRDS